MSIKATREDWLQKACALKPGERLLVHPLDGLTRRTACDAMAAMKLHEAQPIYRVTDHGTTLIISRDKA